MSIFARKKKTGKKLQATTAEKIGSGKQYHSHPIAIADPWPQHLQNGSICEPGYLGFDGEVAPPLIPFDIQAQCLSDPQAVGGGVLRRSSVLNKSLAVSLSDKHALPCLIQYLDSQRVGHLLRFWLAAESFRAAQQEGGGAGTVTTTGGVTSPSARRRVLPGAVTDDGYSDWVSSSSPPLACCDGERRTTPRASPAASECSGDTDVCDGGTADDATDSATRRLRHAAKLKKCIENDAVNIYSTYLALDAKKPIGVSDVLRNEAIRQICQEDGEVDSECFVSCQQFVIDLLQQQHYSDYLQSEFHCQHQITVLTGSTQISLADVLHSESALFYFMEFVEREGALRLLQCWQDLDSFEGLLLSASYDLHQAQNDGMILYGKYFSLQATQPVGFSSTVRCEMENNICREAGPLPNCFTTPKTIVLQTLSKLYFSQYLTSDVYYKFLSELMTTVQTAQYPSFAARKKRTESDASSELSAGSGSTSCSEARSGVTNTLLASGSRARGMTRALARIDADMSMDATLFNPDALWQRSRAGDLSLGKINEAGQFISNIDPEPDHGKKKSSSFFKRRKANEETQEEMALRIAMMIIGEVNVSTQASCSDHT